MLAEKNVNIKLNLKEIKYRFVINNVCKRQEISKYIRHIDFHFRFILENLIQIQLLRKKARSNPQSSVFYVILLEF